MAERSKRCTGPRDPLRAPLHGSLLGRARGSSRTPALNYVLHVRPISLHKVDVGDVRERTFPLLPKAREGYPGAVGRPLAQHIAGGMIGEATHMADPTAPRARRCTVSAKLKLRFSRALQVGVPAGPPAGTGPAPRSGAAPHRAAA